MNSSVAAAITAAVLAFFGPACCEEYVVVRRILFLTMISSKFPTHWIISDIIRFSLSHFFSDLILLVKLTIFSFLTKGARIRVFLSARLYSKPRVFVYWFVIESCLTSGFSTISGPAGGEKPEPRKAFLLFLSLNRLEIVQF